MSWKDDLNYGLAAFGIQLPQRIALDDWAARFPDHPTRNTVALALASTVLFYLAERGRNPKVQDIYDAMVYCTTNLSVGYSDIFARTPLGKVIGSAIMTLGPSMAAKFVDGPRPSKREETGEQILATLREILARLPSPPPASGASPSRSPDAAGSA